MSEQNILITIILPLWDREFYTPTWINENIFEDFKYIIADGSKTDENQDIFTALGNRDNIKYVRYPYDENVTDYVGKMLHAASQVETPYVMICDNDDFLNYQGIIECIRALEGRLDYGFANGPIRTIKGFPEKNNYEKKLYSLLPVIFDTKDLNDKTGIDAIRHLFSQYKYVWYGVYRSDLYKNIWEKVADSKIENIFLIELFQAQLAFCFGKLCCVSKVHYIRLENPVSSSAKELNKVEYPHSYSIYFDDKYRSQVLKMGAIIASLLGVDKQEIYIEYIKYFSNSGNKKTAKRRLFNGIYRRLFLFGLTIKTIRKII